MYISKVYVECVFNYNYYKEKEMENEFVSVTA